MDKVLYESRFPPETKTIIHTKPFYDAVKESPANDLHIVAVEGEEEIPKIVKLSKLKKSFLFVSDSTKEDVFA